MNTKKRNIGARLGALLLCLCLLVGLIPTTALAAETDPFIFGYKSPLPDDGAAAHDRVCVGCAD